MNLFFKKKKGNIILESITVLIIIFALALIFIFGRVVLSDFNSEIQNDTTWSNESKTVMQRDTTNYPRVADAGIVLAFGLLWLVTIATSFFVDTHPVFFAISFILVIIVLIVAASLSNAFEEMTTTDTEFGEAANSFPMTNFLLNHLPYLIFAIAISVAISLYAKSKL